MNKPRISVIVPVRNSRTIRECVESILKQDYGDTDVIVVDNNSEDGSLESIKDQPVRVIREKKKGSYVTRNTGARKAGGEILVFLDADCIPTKEWLKELVSPILDKRVDVVMGYIRNYFGGRWSRIEQDRYDRFLDKEQEGDYIRTISCGNFAIKTEVFRRVGGFDDTLMWSGDVEFGYRLQDNRINIYFNKKAEVRHYQRTLMYELMTHKCTQAYWSMKIYSRQKRYLGEHKRVIREVKTGFFSLITTVLSLVTYLFSGDILFAEASVVGSMITLFFIFGSTHSLFPVIRSGLTDENIFDILHTISWRTGALWYLLENPRGIVDL